MKRFFISMSLLLCTLVSMQAAPAVKNVIFMIGDGMGLSQIYAAAVVNGLEMNIFKANYTGLSLTSSANRFITDSAAGGTALASGVKTNNGMIGMTPDSLSTPSMMELAKKKGLSTGVVVTVGVTHATPAAFYAHNITRKNQEAIALDLLHSDMDCFVGGGRLFLEHRKDSANVSDSLRLKGYDVVYSLDSLKQSTAKQSGALLASIDLDPAADREVMLPAMTQVALDKLSTNKKGFFLMVEGSQIDYQGHNNDIKKLIAEMNEFDQTIGVVMEFAKTHPGTLIVVTADHETGGMVVTDGDISEKRVEANFFSDYHTSTPVPVFSFGTGAEAFTGVYQNTSFFEKIKSLLKL